MIKIDKKRNIKTIWNQWSSFRYFLKSFVVIVFSIFFTIAVFFAWKRHIEEKPQHYKIPQKFSPKIEIQQLTEKVAALQTNVKSLSDRLTVTESTTQKIPLQTSVQIVTLELLRGVLEGLVPLETLRIFLQKNNAPWTTSFLTHLTPVKEIKSYVELEELLVLPSPPSYSSLWQRVKEKVASLIHIRKIDEKGEYNLGKLADVQKALRAHNIQKALEFFEKLPPEKKMPLAFWEGLARDRFILETSEKTLFLELAKGLSE